MDLGLKNRVALVAASSQGLGLATAEAFAAEGCRVAMCARNRKRWRPSPKSSSKEHKTEVLFRGVRRDGSRGRGPFRGRSGGKVRQR